MNAKPTILVVDDIPDNIDLLCAVLEDDYRTKIAVNGERALKIANGESKPDLILLDVMMPGMSGYDVCKALKANPDTRDIPIIFVTAMSETVDEQLGLSLGAADYITKPISAPIVQARIKTQLSMKRVHDFLRDQNSFLETEIEKRTREIVALQDVTIHTMASLAETRDSETGNHIRRTAHYVKTLAEKLRTNPRFSAFLTDKNIELLFKSAPLHDIGKVGIPDRILLKPGRFEGNEFEIMKTHTTLGRDAIRQAERELGLEVDFLKFAKEIAYGHQEKWDGSGYPEGLSGDDIPISARLMAVADVYDALISRRVYKAGMSHEAAVAIIAEGRGKHFDPDMVDAFMELQQDFIDIAKRYADSDHDMEKNREKIERFTG
ncbi:two-component system response regulator [Duganella sp. BJB488]|uniref:response regulator n=1 Tax=unclassified Duganella TaxID=2636909 RepID=UPI000E346F6C|nr:MULTISPECIES: two-component system response regulator [unclassified Duganella]RFP24391.1 two-component system response regulator [Duganella sp. BJB489]RFP26750.1 two-component system response regulator [Duganella sp. BJB488]RFP34516.1 two-component system response regulator [Duganella sp. BJB480]